MFVTRRVAWGMVGVLVLSMMSVVALGAVTDRRVGPRANGTAITPVGYRVTPAGKQTVLGDLPLSLALSPARDLLVASNDGQGDQSLQVIDPTTSRVTQTISYPAPKSLFVGLAFSPDGGTFYASGGGDERIHTFRVSGGQLTETAPIDLPTMNPSGVPVNLFPAGIAASRDGRHLVVADHLGDAVSVVDLSTMTVATVAVGHAPLGVVVSPNGSLAYVSNQGGRKISVVSLSDGEPKVIATIVVGTHPNALALDAAHHLLYVANGDSDSVSVIDTNKNTVRRTIGLAPYKRAKIGTEPTGLALGNHGATIFVTNAGNNDVDVVNTRTATVTGSIPTGWYPSAIAATSKKLYVTNAKGLGAGANNGSGHPDPTATTAANPRQYGGSMMRGTLSTVTRPISSAQLASWTRQVRANDGFDHRTSGELAEPIKHVIYVVQENRTYDQVMGSLHKGNGAPALNLFGDDSAPNQRALQRHFVTLDNFYADAEVSAQGWNWTVAANSNLYTEQLWPGFYSGRHAVYPSEESDPAIAPNRRPSSAYIWDRLAGAHVSFRNYGFYVNQDVNNNWIGTDPVLDAHTDHLFTGFDLRCPDNPDTFAPLGPRCGAPRFTEWKREFDSYVRNNNLPTLEFLRLPNDHTAGTTPGTPTPTAYVADNDLALGRVVDAVSHSKYWKHTAIFVTEDDAQDGPDHVDAHRTLGQVISPYTQTGRVDSSFYSTASMLRTIEDLVGIRPMTQFDTYATPMSASFTARPVNTKYRVLLPSVSRGATNSVAAPLAAASAAQPLYREDQIDMTVFNEAIWQSVKGRRSPMPPPRHGLSAPGTAQGDGEGP